MASVIEERPSQGVEAEPLGPVCPPYGSFLELYRDFLPQVELLLRPLIGSSTAVEEAAQETFVRLHDALSNGQVDPDRSLRAYVLAIARNVAVAELRRRDRANQLERRRISPQDPADVAQRKEAQGLVTHALEALEPELRVAFVLRHVHALKLRELAEALDVSERTARNRLRTAAVLFERELRQRGLGPQPTERSV